MSLIVLYFVLAILVAIIATLRGRAWWRWLLLGLFLTPIIAGLLVMVLPPEPHELVYYDELGMPPMHSMQPPQPQIESLPPNCLVRIIRLSGYKERNRHYDIFINGIRAGIVAHDGVVDFDVPRGQHVIEARTGRGGSRPLLIDAGPDYRVEIEVTKRSGMLVALKAETFGCGDYLTLRLRPPTPMSHTPA